GPDAGDVTPVEVFVDRVPVPDLFRPKLSRLVTPRLTGSEPPRHCLDHYFPVSRRLSRPSTSGNNRTIAAYVSSEELRSSFAAITPPYHVLRAPLTQERCERGGS